jgi:hypothetical protein
MQVPQLGEGAEEMTKIRTWLRGLPGADAKDQGASYPEGIPELFRLLLIPGVRLWGSMCGGFCSSSFCPASASAAAYGGQRLQRWGGMVRWYVCGAAGGSACALAKERTGLPDPPRNGAVARVRVRARGVPAYHNHQAAICSRFKWLGEAGTPVHARGLSHQ